MNCYINNKVILLKIKNKIKITFLLITLKGNKLFKFVLKYDILYIKKVKTDKINVF